jgi:Na+-transporting methylmalonyl-CoA/oxaloacetate decarboxylase gamma subunit
MKETSRKLKVVNWMIVGMTIVMTIILTFLIFSSL